MKQLKLETMFPSLGNTSGVFKGAAIPVFYLGGALRIDDHSFLTSAASFLHASAAYLV